MANPTLKVGARGQAVRSLQETLQDLGFDPGPIDGIFGQGTTEAVRRFQQARHLEVDGVVGRGMWEHLAVAPSGGAGSDQTRGTSTPQSGAARSLSDNGTHFIAQFEGFRADLYNDAAGHCTIGFGHLVHKGKIDGTEPAEFKAGISRERALEILKADAGKAADAVNRSVKVGLNQPQFDALVSFVFNLGPGNFQKSTLLRRLNAGDYSAVPSELLKWNKAGGRVLAGLTRRRQAEGGLFSTGRYG